MTQTILHPGPSRRMRLGKTLLAASFLCSAAACTQAPCDRACTIDVTDRYLAAVASHDPSAAPLADDVRFVENAQRTEVGEGLWQSATGGPTAFSIHVPDPVNQSAGWIGMMEQEGKPVLVALRLKLDGNRIVEVEHRITDVRDNVLDRLKTPRAGLLADVSADKRLDHDTLIRIGGSYYDAVDDNDGTKMPFAADCQRQENGMITAGEGAGQGPASQGVSPIASDCTGQLSSGVMTYITTIDDRQVFAADPQTGLAMGFSVLRHPMDFPPYEVTSLDGSKSLWTKERLGYAPWDNAAAHIWKIGADGKVHEIEAMGFRVASEAPTHWDDVSR